jgi:hypothetical protein
LGAAGSEPWQTLGERKSSLAVMLRQHANILEGECKALRLGSALRRLGAPGNHGNAEWLDLLRESFDLSYGELALMVKTALGAWKKPEVDDIDPQSLRRSITRFRQRIPDRSRSSGN